MFSHTEDGSQNVMVARDDYSALGYVYLYLQNGLEFYHKSRNKPVSRPYLRMPSVSIQEVIGKSLHPMDVETRTLEMGRVGVRGFQVQVSHFTSERSTGIQRERGTSLWSHGGVSGFA